MLWIALVSIYLSIGLSIRHFIGRRERERERERGRRREYSSGVSDDDYLAAVYTGRVAELSSGRVAELSSVSRAAELVYKGMKKSRPFSGAGT
jgi:hypothetical protein